MWEVYDALIESLPEAGSIEHCYKNQWWTLAETDSGSSGLAMTVPWAQRPAIFPKGLDGLSVREAAEAVKSWNLAEAAGGMSAINAACNTPERLSQLRCGEPFENYCTRGIDFRGKTVGIVGHLKFPEGMLAGAKEIFILERAPQDGDYPDSAGDFLLPRCDVALITGSSLVNKTLPHLLELTKNAYTILTGPTVPMCPALFDCGIDRLSGMVVTDRTAARGHVTGDLPGSPYFLGETFLLVKDK